MDMEFTSNDNQNEDHDPFGSELLEKFSRLNTNDREVLMKEFRMFLGDQTLSDEKVEFWLDMSNWNLQAALCAYFDFETSGFCKLPSAEIALNTQPQQFEFYPNIPFIYQCTVINSGDEPWPHGCVIRLCNGTKMSDFDLIIVPDLEPQGTFQIKIPLISPSKSGSYFSQYRLTTMKGQFFGEPIYIIVNVLDDINQVAKQLSAAHIVDQQQQQPNNQLYNNNIDNNNDNNNNNSNNNLNSNHNNNVFHNSTNDTQMN